MNLKNISTSYQAFYVMRQYGVPNYNHCLPLLFLMFSFPEFDSITDMAEYVLPYLQEKVLSSDIQWEHG